MQAVIVSRPPYKVMEVRWNRHLVMDGSAPADPRRERESEKEECTHRYKVGSSVRFPWRIDSKLAFIFARSRGREQVPGSRPRRLLLASQCPFLLARFNGLG
jgi:hypothetical protein